MTSNNNKKLIEMPKIDSDVWSVWNDATAFRKTRVLCQTFGLNDDESLIVVKTPGKVLIDEDNVREMVGSLLICFKFAVLFNAFLVRSLNDTVLVQHDQTVSRTGDSLGVVECAVQSARRWRT